ncbi:CAP-Gly domain-containing linker protein 4-like isoform X2 [Hetaerina americana]
MTLLHYSCKAGASGVGDVDSALNVVEMLIGSGVDVHLRCKWTKMNALHYAAFFDVAPIIKVLIERCKGIDINSTCPSYDNGTALHICATNLCLDAANVLLELGADVTSKDDSSRIPLECIPDKSTYDLIPDVNEQIIRMEKLLTPGYKLDVEEIGKTNLGVISGKAVLKAMNLCLNDRVIIGGCKAGILRYCGSTEFAPGIWAGVELDDNEGKNDGSVNGVVYFKCSSNHGIFSPIDRVCKVNDAFPLKISTSCKPNSKQVVNHGKIDISHVTPKVCTGLNLGNKLKEMNLGDKVIVRRNGVSRENEDSCGWVRYIGATDFASGTWIGVELDRKTEGRHDGSIGGKCYFTCPPQQGILIPVARFKRLSTKGKSSNVGCHAFQSEGKKTVETIWEAYCVSSSKKNLVSGSKIMSSDSHNSTPKHLLRSFSTGHSLTVSLASSCRPRNCRANVLKRAKSCEGSGHTAAIGMNALYNHKIGIVKYVGPVEFAEGNWLGLELRENKGKHDGLVNGKRYFTSKPGHGIMVQSKNVTIHGINGEKLFGS